MKSRNLSRDPHLIAPRRGGRLFAFRNLAGIEQAKLGLALLLLVVGFLLGGTSGDFPGRAMVIELVAVMSLTLTLATWHGPRPSWAAIAGTLLILALPLMQLIPLPPKIWQIFPGRDVAREIAAFIDPDMWRPITLDSDATMKSWLSLFVPVAMFLAVLQLPSAQRLLLCYAVIAIGMASLLLGMIQATSGNDRLYLFDSTQNGLPLGFFANRNHQAALMYVSAGMSLLMAKRASLNGSAQRLLYFGLVFVFTAGIFATGSRAGLGLLGVTILLFIPIFAGHRINWWMALVGAASVAAFGFLLSQSGVVQDAVARFALLSTEGRYDIWSEAWFAANAYYPIGAGLGTFVKSYQAMEPLAAVTPYYVNHAHNDYLELVLELGVCAYLAIGLFLAWYATRTFRVLFREPRDSANLVARAALIAILALLLHSIVDYPIRTFAHLGLFGMLCSLLYRPPQMRQTPADAGARPEEIQTAMSPPNM